jgi:hypothetical protein
MIYMRAARSPWPRRLGIALLSGSALGVLLHWFVERPVQERVQLARVSRPAQPPEMPVGAAPAVRVAATPEPPRRIAQETPTVPTRTTPVPVRFKFFGKTSDGGVTSVILFGGGRTLTVRGTGPIGEDYVVDAFQPEYVMLRHVTVGTTQLIELVPPRQAVAVSGSPEDSPQD